MIDGIKKWIKSVCGRNKDTENNAIPLPKKIFVGLFGIMVSDLKYIFFIIWTVFITVYKLCRHCSEINDYFFDKRY